MKQIGYLGPEGTFSQEAAKHYAKQSHISPKSLHPFLTIYEVMQAVESRKVNFGVVPIENSIEGSINAVTDSLVRKKRIFICGEIIRPVRHTLLAGAATRDRDIQEIVSHPQALEQCEGYLQKHFRHAILHMTASTAEAARQLCEGFYSPHTAVIGSELLAKLYHLRIMRRGIQDSNNNVTRFVILASRDHSATGRDKTSIVFTMEKDRPGGLYGILKEFAMRKINLTKIESRPMKTALGEYYFFLDCEGHREDRLVAQTLNALKPKVSFLKILGSYPREHE